MAIINKNPISTTSLESRFFHKVFKSMDDRNKTYYLDKKIFLFELLDDKIRLNDDFGYNLFELGLDKWEEYGYSKEIILDSTLDRRINIRLKGNNIQNYTFKGRNIGFIIDNTQIFKNNNLCGINNLRLFLFNKKYEDCGQPLFGYNFLKNYGYRGTSLEDLKDKLLDGNSYPLNYNLYLGKSKSKIPKYDIDQVVKLFNNKNIWLF